MPRPVTTALCFRVLCPFGHLLYCTISLYLVCEWEELKGKALVSLDLVFSYSLPERDYVTFGSLLSQIRLSSVTFLCPTQRF